MANSLGMIRRQSFHCATLHLVHRNHDVAMADKPERQIAAVTDVTDSSDDALPDPERGRRRKRALCPPSRRTRPVDDIIRIQTMLSKKSRCKANCKDYFRGKAGLQELCQFRSEWAQLHKIDQDEVAPL